MKKIVYIDMDGVLVDFVSGINRTSEADRRNFLHEEDNIPGIFSLMLPIPDAIESYKKVARIYDVFILSTAPWENSTAWGDKLIWVQKYLGEDAYKRLILTHRKDLNRGDYLIGTQTGLRISRDSTSGLALKDFQTGGLCLGILGLSNQRDILLGW